MNPRYRRLLIPGLLIVLLVVVIVSSLARRADGVEADSARPEVVSRLTDQRITESSGLALSREHDGIAYTINDSGNAALVFAIDLASGHTVGTTRVEGGRWRDTEALAIDRDGMLWVADTGDNDGKRSDAALYALPEPGSGDRTVTAKRYPITYDSGPANVEALLVNPVTGAKFLVSKALLAGTVFALPAELSTEHANAAATQPHGAPSSATDATFTADGTHVVVRSYTSLSVVDPSDWSVLATAAAPPQDQGETIAAEADSLLLGSEGGGSELVRVPTPTPSPEPDQTPAMQPVASDSETAPMLYVFGAVGAAVVVGAGVALIARRSR